MTQTKWIHGTGRKQGRERLENLTRGDQLDFAAEMVRRAGLALEAGDIRAAEMNLRKGLARVPDHAECRAYLAICMAAGRRKFVTAEKLAQNILQNNPYEPTAYYALGRIYLLGGRRSAAFKHFAKARALAHGDRDLEGRLRKADPRRPPVLRFLPRDHAVNILLGRLRSLLVGGARG